MSIYASTAASKTNPIQSQSNPIQSQSKPIQSQYKANTKPIQSQYKPNSRKAKMKLNFYSTKDYENELCWKLQKNKPNQTQTNPICSGPACPEQAQRVEGSAPPALRSRFGERGDGAKFLNFHVRNNLTDLSDSLKCVFFRG